MNFLKNETSPYLLQHAHNPVNWYPWGEEALKRAVAENKPILVSIGYSACHWCHVMERESFEDPATAAIMNEHFINIKIDREERPDLDHIYMDAVQAITGRGGWPLNVFLTPDGKPFYGGTYFPPKKAFNMPSWTDVLHGVSEGFSERRGEIDQQAETLTRHLLDSNSFGMQAGKGGDEFFTQQLVDQAALNLMQTADTEWGGFGKAPKFPQTFSIRFLLRYYYITSGKKMLDQALLSLDKMLDGGIYDQVGGGFARYSTDTEWLAPHFEKMLYDNALLVSVLSEAYQLTHEHRYCKAIEETMEFVRRELLHPANGFFAALDADSEGVEGKFYVWSLGEVKQILGEDAELFAAYYDITEHGNWEGNNIPRVLIPMETFAATNGIEIERLSELLERGKQKLLEKRSARTRPQLDDKVILGWNAMMNSACSKAFAATGNVEYRQLAVDNMHFVLENFKTGTREDFYHTWKDGKAKYPAFLDDYACLVQALIDLQEVTGERMWLDRAASITETVIEKFEEESTEFFYYTKIDQSDVIVRKKEMYDGAVPSGNATMAYNLYQLGLLLDRDDWKKRSRGMVASLGQVVIKYPGSFGVWAALYQEMVAGTLEIAILGKEHKKLLEETLGLYLPHRVLMAAKGEESYPLLTGKNSGNDTMIWLCRDYTCLRPVSTVDGLTALIHKGKMSN